VTSKCNWLFFSLYRGTWYFAKVLFDGSFY